MSGSDSIEQNEKGEKTTKGFDIFFNPAAIYEQIGEAYVVVGGEIVAYINENSVNDEVTIEAMDEYILAVSKVMTQNEIKRLKLMLAKELDVDKKKKIMLQIVELKKEDV